MISPFLIDRLSDSLFIPAKVRKKRQEADKATGHRGPVPRSVKQLMTFPNGKTRHAGHGHKLATYLREYMAGKRSDDNLNKYSDKSFSETYD